MARKEWCEECKEMKASAYRRPDMGGRTLCNQHYYEALRRITPTNLVRRPAPRELPEWMTEGRQT
jgi:hypothetical protein